MTFGLATAIHYWDVPRSMRTAARNYRRNVEDNKELWEGRGDPQGKIWDYAASLMEQSAQQLEMRIKELKPARAKLSTNAIKPKRERLRK